jgi:GNAT superfamily N-acetyltransferase
VVKRERRTVLAVFVRAGGAQWDAQLCGSAFQAGRQIRYFGDAVVHAPDQPADAETDPAAFDLSRRTPADARDGRLGDGRQAHFLAPVGERVGYASWSLEASTWQAAEYAHLDCLYLREATRGRGAGRLLMGAVEAEARSAGAGELQWQTPAWNEGAIRFYRRTGARDDAKARFTLPLTDPSRT